MTFDSVITVIPTFFRDTLNIDFEAIIIHIEKQYQSGIRTIVILGTTSETPTLTLAEKNEIATIVYNSFGNKMKIIIGISGFNTVDVLNEAISLKPFCDTFMLSPPYYNKPSQEGIFQHYSHIMNYIDKNFIIYNVPSRCGVNIEPETINRIYRLNNRVVAVKEASGSIEQVIKTRALCNVDIYSGDDLLTIPFMSVGAKGVISVVSNLIPIDMIYMCTKFLQGNTHDAMLSFYKNQELMRLCFVESNPVPIKYMLHLIDRNKLFHLNLVRLPLVELSEASKQKIIKFMSDGYQFTEQEMVD